MDKLISLIKNKAFELSKTSIPNLKEAEFLEAFLKEFNVNDFHTYLNVSNSGYLGVLLLANCIDMDFDEFFDNLKKVKRVIDVPDLDVDGFTDYFNALGKLNEEGLLDDDLENKDMVTANLFRSINEELFTIEEDGESFYDHAATQAMIKLFKALPKPEIFSSFTDIDVIIDCLKIAYDEMFDEPYEKVITKTSTSKEKIRFLKQVMHHCIEDYGLTIFEDYNTILQRYETIYSVIKNTAKEGNRKIAKLEKLHRQVEGIPKGTLVKLDGDLNKMLVDKEVEYQYLLFALKRNFSIHSLAEQKNQEYNNNSITKMDIIFNKYNFNFNDIDEENQNKIISLGVETVEDILKLIRYSDLNFISEYSDLFANTIIFSSPRIIRVIDNSLKNKLISKEFVLENNKLLYDSELFSHFFNNITCLTNLGVNLANRRAEEVLLLDSVELAKQLDILGEYKFKLYDEKFSNYNLFKEDKLLDYFDNFIELGYSDTILENPRYLNENSSDMIKRIMISRLICFSPVNNQNKFIGAITTGNNFYLNPSEYDKFIMDYKEDYQNPLCLEVLENNNRNAISVSTKNMPIIKSLDDNFMKDSLTYVIDDVVISRKRVMRNLEVLTKNIETMNMQLNDLLFQAILYNMINNIEPEKLERIYNAISQINIDNIKIYKFN